MTAPVKTMRLACLALALPLMLSACGGEQDELQAWMDHERQQVKPNVQPLSPPQKFNP